MPRYDLVLHALPCMTVTYEINELTEKRTYQLGDDQVRILMKHAPFVRIGSLKAQRLR